MGTRPSNRLNQLFIMKHPLKIALIGYGKMGKAIEEAAIQRGHSIILKIDKDNEGELNAESLKKADVAIEFTNPEAAVNNILRCLQYGTPVVSGSTGWLQHWEEVQAACEKMNGSLLYASNFSVGVNLFFELNKKLASLMAGHKEYEVSLEEIHHTAKKDAPSGTAITLAEQILAGNPAKKKWINKESDNAEDLVIISKRIDPAPGTHSITYTSPIDDIRIEHTAHNRQGFALGAVLAAEYLADKKGIHQMKDVLGL
jgi:4-hydroxy-tetrahydrodipicolinate reductase